MQSMKSMVIALSVVLIGCAGAASVEGSSLLILAPIVVAAIFALIIEARKRQN